MHGVSKLQFCWKAVNQRLPGQKSMREVDPVNLLEKSMNVVRYRKVLCILALLCLAPHGRAAEQVCDGSEPMATPSPKGGWTASVQERVCSTDRGAAAAVMVTVAQKDAPTAGERVVSIAVPRSRDEWPRVVWRSETSLEVWVPNFAHVLEVKPAFRDVTVALKYCADDPDARASVAQHQVDVKRWQETVTRWAALRKTDPEGVGPRPPRPVEPSVARRPCQAGDIP